MTRVLFLPNPTTLIVTESPTPAQPLAAALNAGTASLGLPGEAALPPGSLHALAHGDLVIVLAGEMLANAQPPAPAPRLPLREQQVLQGLAEGLTGKEIAEQLGLSRRTVSVYIARLKAHLGVQAPTEAVLRGVALGLLPARAPTGKDRWA